MKSKSIVLFSMAVVLLGALIFFPTEISRTWADFMVHPISDNDFKKYVLLMLFILCIFNIVDID